jgi:hypothetical protein
LGGDGDGQRAALRQNFAGRLTEAMLQCLPFHRPDNAQPNRGSNEAAQVLEEKHAPGAAPFKTEGASDHSKNWREMSAWRTDDVASGENLFRRGKKRPALEPAGAIGHMIGDEGVAPLVQHGELARIVVRRADKRKAGMAELSQAAFQQASQFGRIPSLTVLPGRFQSAAVGEAAGGKCRIGQLP